MRAKLQFVVLFVLIAATGFSVLPAAASAFSEEIHEDVTTEALGFLRPDVLEDVRDEHDGFADDPEGEDVGWLHADNCAFGETAQQINVLQDDAVNELVPGTGLVPWSASDHFGLPLHPAQDFYSHSNWVELGFPANGNPTPSDLVDFGTTLAGPEGLGPWGTPPPLGTVRGDILMDDVVTATVVNPEGPILRYKDATVEPIPSNWAIGLLPHPTLAGQAGFVPGIDKTGGVANFTQLPTFGSFSVPVLTSPADHRFLISGVGARPAADVYANQCDPYRRGPDGAVIEPRQTNSCWPPLVFTSDGEFERLPDDYSCIAYHGSRFALSHSGSARSELNKDSPGEAPTRHPKARALALLQSKYEWCRFLSEAGHAGSDGVALALWVKEGASPHPANTPCAPDGGNGPRGVTLSIDEVDVLNDKDNDSDEPGEINLSMALYDSPFAFHRSVKSKSGPVFADDDGSSRPASLPDAALPPPVSLCVHPHDSDFRVALHGWDDDEGSDDGAESSANGDFNEHGTSPGPANVDDPLVGFSATHSASNISVGSPIVRSTTSDDLRVTYRMARIADTDGDRLDACGEPFYGTDPANPDSDADGLPDGIEVEGSNPTDPLVADSDADGLKDGQEDVDANGSLDAGETDPNDPDTDNDLLSDGVEVNGANATDPLVPDSDADGLIDGQEDANANGSVDAGETDPNDPDSDNDGLEDGLEVEFGIDPLDADSDDDGLPDGQDVDWIAAAIRALPASAFKSPANGNRIATLNLLADAEALLLKGKVKPALEMLATLRRRLDGCGTSPDGNDWIVDCTAQIKIRALVDLLRGNL